MYKNKVILYVPAGEEAKTKRLMEYCKTANLEIVYKFEENDDDGDKPAPERRVLCALIQFLKYDVFKSVVIDDCADIALSSTELSWIKEKINDAGKTLTFINNKQERSFAIAGNGAAQGIEAVYLETNNRLEKDVQNCSFKNYPDQYGIVIGVKKCFLKCRSCIDVILPSNNLVESEMPMELFKKSIDYIPGGLKDIPVILCPGAETLTIKNLIPMLHYITDTKPDALSITNTNGLLLTKKMSEAIIDSGLRNLMISINAPNREEYKWFTGVDSFQKLENNIHEFVEMKKRKNSKTPFVRVQIFGIKRFEKYIDEFMDRWRDVVDAVEVTPLAFCGHIPELENSDKFKRNTKYPIVMTCGALFRNIMIYPDGAIFPCTSPTPPMKNHFPVTMGNAYIDNPFTVWNSEEYRKLREKNLNGLPIMEECLSCDRIVSGDWTIVESLEEDLLRKEKLKRLIGVN